MQSNFRHLTEDIRRQIEEALAGVGILCRVFARGKDGASIAQKMRREPGKYSSSGRKIQDSIGVRVALYFSEDISIVKAILETKYRLDPLSSTIDTPDRDQFSVTRYNLIFHLPEDMCVGFQRIAASAPLDATFEVQLRSILSEGWHEVEHDLRYKAKENWLDHDDLSRALNGVVATLETAEWSMGRIFDELAYRHYRQKNWVGMLPNLLKLRLKGELSQSLLACLDEDSAAAKDLLRIDRAKLIRALFRARPRVPVTMDNLVYFWNAIGPQHESLSSLTPLIVSEAAASVEF